MVRDFVQVRACGLEDKQRRIIIPDGLGQCFRKLQGIYRRVEIRVDDNSIPLAVRRQLYLDKLLPGESAAAERPPSYLFAASVFHALADWGPW